jgi:hypothetical protein
VDARARIERYAARWPAGRASPPGRAARLKRGGAWRGSQRKQHVADPADGVRVAVEAHAAGPDRVGQGALTQAHGAQCGLVGSTQMVSMLRPLPRWPCRLALDHINGSVLLDLVRLFLYLHLSAVAGLDLKSWELVNSPNVYVL